MINWKSKSATNVVAAEVKKSPDNLKHAFQQAAQRLNCSFYSVKTQWYQNGLREQLGHLFSTVSPKKDVVNKKNQPKPSEKERLIYSKKVKTSNVDGMRVVTVVNYYAI